LKLTRPALHLLPCEENAECAISLRFDSKARRDCLLFA
jgi:hypothetical protein